MYIFFLFKKEGLSYFPLTTNNENPAQIPPGETPT